MTFSNFVKVLSKNWGGQLTLSLLLVASLCATGCLETEFSESESRFEVSASSVEVHGYPLRNEAVVRDTINVISNRSWSAEVLDGESWVNLSRNSNSNISKTTETTMVVMEFGENLDPNASRNATLRITAKDHEPINVSIVQKPFEPRLEVDALEYLVPPGDTTLVVDVYANCAWEPTTVGDLFFETQKSQSSKNGKLKVYFSEIVGTGDPIEYTITLTAPEYGKSIELKFYQELKASEVKIDMDPVVEVPSYSYSTEVEFKSNEDWTAELLEGTSPGVNLFVKTTEEDGENDHNMILGYQNYSNGSGAYNCEFGSVVDGMAYSSGLYVYWPSYRDGTELVAVVKITNASGASSQVTIKLTPFALFPFSSNPIVILPFRTYPDEFGWSSNNYCWFKNENNMEIGFPVRNANGRKDTYGAGYLANKNDVFSCYDLSGYDYSIFSGGAQSDLYVNSGGFVIGSNEAGRSLENPSFWITIPAVEGKTLKGVRIMTGLSDRNHPVGKPENAEVHATGRSAAITDLSGNVVEGGQEQTVSDYAPVTTSIASFEYEYDYFVTSMFDFKLTGTSQNTPYRIVGTSTRMIIRWIIFYYE